MALASAAAINQAATAVCKPWAPDAGAWHCSLACRGFVFPHYGTSAAYYGKAALVHVVVRDAVGREAPGQTKVDEGLVHTWIVSAIGHGAAT